LKTLIIALLERLFLLISSDDGLIFLAMHLNSFVIIGLIGISFGNAWILVLKEFLTIESSRE
jgi:hypothetical protein